MQVDQSNKLSQSAPPLPPLQDNMDITSIILLPLHAYHTYQGRVSTQALPMQAMTGYTDKLPAELIEMIQHFCSPRDRLALTSVNKAAFATRFHNPLLQHLCFTTATQVEQFLASCWETQKTVQYTGAIRIREDFQQVKRLTLALSDQLNLKQCERLFACLPNIEYLKIRPTSEQSLASLGPILKAAKPFALKQLTLAAPLKHIPRVEDTLPDEVWQWPTLKSLNLLCLSGITHISEDIGKLAQLTSLRLAEQRNPHAKPDPAYQLIALPESLGQLQKLEELVLENLRVSTLPKAIRQLKALKLLTLEGMSSLKILPANMWELPRLEKLSLYGLACIEKIPEQIGRLKTLKSLKLEFKEALPASLGQLGQLEELNLAEAFSLDNNTINPRRSNIKKIPEEIGQLKALKSLTLCNMHTLPVLPSWLWQLEKLERLELNSLSSIEILPDEIAQLQALKSLHITDMQSLKVLSVNLWQLTNLEELALSILEIGEVPEEIAQLTALKSLELNHMPLKALPRTLGQLNKLEQLKLYELAIEEIPEGISQLSALRSLELCRLPIKAWLLPVSLGQLAKLETLILDRILYLPEIFRTIGQLTITSSRGRRLIYKKAG